MDADVIQGLVAIAAADAGVAALAGARIFGDELPPDETGAMPRKALVLRPSGGPQFIGGKIRHTAQRVDALSYGETKYEAGRLQRAVFTAFKNVERQVAGGVLVHWVADAGGFASGRDPDGDWPLAFQSFQAFYAETAVA